FYQRQRRGGLQGHGEGDEQRDGDQRRVVFGFGKLHGERDSHRRRHDQRERQPAHRRQRQRQRRRVVGRPRGLRQRQGERLDELVVFGFGDVHGRQRGERGSVLHSGF